MTADRLVQKLRQQHGLSGGDAVCLYIDERQERSCDDAGQSPAPRRAGPACGPLRFLPSIHPCPVRKAAPPAGRAEHRATRLLQEAFFLQVGLSNGLRRLAIHLDLGVQLAQFVGASGS